MTDSQLIENLGGPTKVAELLKFDKQGGVQRVQNWLTRGIPAHVKVNYPHLFMPAHKYVGDLAIPTDESPKTQPVTRANDEVATDQQITQTKE